jgi:hypothetical protein
LLQGFDCPFMELGIQQALPEFRNLGACITSTPAAMLLSAGCADEARMHNSFSNNQHGCLLTFSPMQVFARQRARNSIAAY